MTIEQFQRYQEESFDAFCKTVIRNESANAHNELDSRSEKEIVFSALPPNDLHSLMTVDVYRPYCKKYRVLGNIVCVYDATLGGSFVAYHSESSRDYFVVLFLRFQ